MHHSTESINTIVYQVLYRDYAEDTEKNRNEPTVQACKSLNTNTYTTAWLTPKKMECTL